MIQVFSTIFIPENFLKVGKYFQTVKKTKPNLGALEPGCLSTHPGHHTLVCVTDSVSSSVNCGL